jgi:hypothetical protein
MACRPAKAGRMRAGLRVPENAGKVSQMRVDIFEDGRRQLVIIEKPVKLEQGRCIGGEVHADEPTGRLVVVERIFDRRIRQTETLLGDVHAQHLLQPDRRASATLALRIEGFDRSQQCRPWGDRFDLSTKPITLHLALLSGILELRKARLNRPVQVKHPSSNCPSGTRRKKEGPPNKAVFP